MKNLILLCLLCPLLSVRSVYAHAVVTHSSLNVDDVAPHQATQVRLSFNSRVELNLSQIFLVSAGDKKQLVSASMGEKQGQVVIHLPPLGVGEYALQLKIFAADGHLSEDLVRFFVKEQKLR